MLKLTTTEAREMLSELVNRAAFGDERVVLTRHGKEMAVIISMADLEKLEASAALTVGRKKALSVEERKEKLARGRAAFRALSASASSANITDDDVEAEIEAVLKERRRR